MGLSCLAVLSAVSCDKESKEPTIAPPLGKVSFSFSEKTINNIANLVENISEAKDGTISFEKGDKIKLYIVTVEKASTDDVKYYTDKDRYIGETFDEKSGTELTFDENGNIKDGFYLEGKTGDEGKAYILKRFDIIKKEETAVSYVLKNEIPFKVKTNENNKVDVVVITNQKISIKGISTMMIPDANFKAYLKRRIPGAFPGGGDKIDINHEKVKSLLRMDVNGKGIKSLQGIEYFTALTELYCYHNQLTTLDVSKNDKLIRLNCYDNQLKKLDVSKNDKLTYLYCVKNQLTTLDVSKNDKLIRLYCGKNQLTTLDLSQNNALTQLICPENQLTTLDVSKNDKLTHLNCYDDQLKTLDLSQNTKLTQLICSDNQLKTLNVRQNDKLTKIVCWKNKLTTLDLSQNNALTQLDCGKNQLKKLDLSQNTHLTDLYCYNNQLTKLDVSQNTKLTKLHCLGNQLKNLDLSKNCGLKKEKYGIDIITDVSKDNIKWCSS